MKKSMTGVVALLAGAFAVHCQGIVSFCNYLVLSPYIYVSLGSTLLGGSSTVTTGVPEVDVGNGDDWTVALYGNAGGNDVASNLVQLETEGGQPVMTNLETGNLDDADPGTWVYGYDTDAVVPGTSAAGGSLVTVQIRAWYNRGGQYTTYEAALSANLPVGVSALANMVDAGQVLEGAPQPAPSLPSGTGPGELGNIILSFPTVSRSGPVLTVTVNADPLGAQEPSSIILTWPGTNGGFTLQSATNLGSPMVWANVSNAPVVVNGQNTVTNIITSGQQFFRLSNP